MGCFKEFTRGFAKFILIIFNFLILLAACLLIALSVKGKVHNAGIDVMHITNISLGLGVVVAFISFFGCFGAFTGNSCMLTTYAVICLLLAITQLILGIFTFISIKNNTNQLEDIVRKNLDELYGNHTNEYFNVVDHFQRELECCGRMTEDPLVKNGTGLIKSCCPPETTVCTTAVAFKDSCTSKLTNAIISVGQGLGITSLIFCATELLAALFACYVRQTKEQNVPTA